MDIMNDGIYRKALHEPAELFWGQSTEVSGGAGPGETAGIHSLIEEKISIAFPEKTFDPCGGPAAEQEERVWNEDVHAIVLPDDVRKGIDAKAEVCVTADEIDSREGRRIRIPKHSVPPG